MSQISHSQLALKKRNTLVHVAESATNDTQKANRKSNNLNDSNGHNDNDKDIITIDDEYSAIPVSREETVEEESTITGKKKRNRRSKNSSDSRESSEFTIKKTEENKTKQHNKNHSDEKNLNIVTANFVEKATPEASPKVVTEKLTADALNTKRRSDRLQNASTIVNLSTVSLMDQSTKVSNDTLETPSTETQFIGTYRTPNNIDDSLNATTNATIGSEIGDLDINTPATDRKRRLIIDDDVGSPKRSRLDLSVLFNNFYSPVSILRNKFKRTNLASTPKNANAGLLDDSEDIDVDDLKEIELNEKSIDNSNETKDNEMKMVVKPKKSSCTIM
ncbi:hypothetical protein PVAND_003690 [Polypedilum vanderplanki]|uniref:Uncharacterized protein n=1 Tax=Polypedilum vanderplanki TaxID=319348 RepID=A0A9J6BUU1_POLVA|nr:hypothetical protein PVAND_003690 [Polypedilum vanderplanki]